MLDAKNPAGTPVLAREYPSGVDAYCPGCPAPVRIRDPQDRVRHFYHYKGSSCGYESDIHIWMKHIVADRLDEIFPDGEVTIERSLYGTRGTEIRRADVAVTFSGVDPVWGAGIAVECQYEHKDKQIEQTEWDLLSVGYSVVWLYEDDFDFENEKVSLPFGPAEDGVETPWPQMACGKLENSPRFESLVTCEDVGSPNYNHHSLVHDVRQGASRGGPPPGFPDPIPQAIAQWLGDVSYHGLPSAVRRWRNHTFLATSGDVREWLSRKGGGLGARGKSGPSQVTAECPSCGKTVDAFVLQTGQVRLTKHSASQFGGGSACGYANKTLPKEQVSIVDSR